MDAGIIDAINRRDVKLMVARLDALDLPKYKATHGPWYLTPTGDILAGHSYLSHPDRAWLVGSLAANLPGIAFDGEPAGGDWENLFSHFRAEVLARRVSRDPKTPHADRAETPPCGVV
jgi:hypothetical protein